MEKKTTATVISVKKQWWLKVNTKPFRHGTLDGALFPHIIRAAYVVDGREFFKRKGLGARIVPPRVGDRVTVIYRAENPQKCRIEME